MVLIIPIIFCSCKKQEKFEPQTSGFSCEALIDTGEMKFNCKIKIGNSGDFCAEMTAPEILKGMKCEYINDKVKVSFLGIEKELPADALPYFNYAGIIKSVLGSIGSSIEAVRNDNGYSYDSRSSKGNFHIKFRADGFPIEIDVPSANLTVILNNFEYIY